MHPAQYCPFNYCSFIDNLYVDFFFSLYLSLTYGPVPISPPLTMNSCLRTSCNVLLRILFIFSMCPFSFWGSVLASVVLVVLWWLSLRLYLLISISDRVYHWEYHRTAHSTAGNPADLFYLHYLLCLLYFDVKFSRIQLAKQQYCMHSAAVNKYIQKLLIAKKLINHQYNFFKIIWYSSFPSHKDLLHHIVSASIYSTVSLPAFSFIYSSLVSLFFSSVKACNNTLAGIS